MISNDYRQKLIAREPLGQVPVDPNVKYSIYKMLSFEVFDLDDPDNPCPDPPIANVGYRLTYPVKLCWSQTTEFDSLAETIDFINTEVFLIDRASKYSADFYQECLQHSLNTVHVNPIELTNDLVIAEIELTVGQYRIEVILPDPTTFRLYGYEFVKSAHHAIEQQLQHIQDTEYYTEKLWISNGYKEAKQIYDGLKNKRPSDYKEPLISLLWNEYNYQISILYGWIRENHSGSVKVTWTNEDYYEEKEDDWDLTDLLEAKLTHDTAK
jgi:hypothetical protein